MITSRTITASSPVAAWRSSADMLSLSEPTIRTAIHHVIKVATNAKPAPKATGRRCVRFGPVMLAVIAAKTSMHSNPSRNTRTPISRNATVGLVLGRVGSGAPCALTSCQTSIAITKSAAATTPMRKAGFMLSFRPYHRDKASAGDGLLFFSDYLLVRKTTDSSFCLKLVYKFAKPFTHGVLLDLGLRFGR